MVNQKKGTFWKLVILVSLTLVLGCASNPRALDRSAARPQLIVNPDSILLGIVQLMGTKIAFLELKPTNIVFEGSGFKPNDSVFVTLTGPDQTKIVVAEAMSNSNIVKKLQD